MAAPPPKAVGTQAPNEHTDPSAQVAQSPPVRPQARSVPPGWQASLLSQQPVQVEGPHAVGAADGQPKNKASAALAKRTRSVMWRSNGGLSTHDPRPRSRCTLYVESSITCRGMWH